MAGAPKGNTNAKKENRLITDALRRAVVQSPDKLKKACEVLLNKAGEGDLAAFNAIADRLDGKPAQSITHSGDESAPLITKVERVIVNSTDKDG
jgi:hypothetical protein